jgi:hypothetical protein
MDFTDTVEVLWVGGRFLRVGGSFEVESILEVSGGVLLWDEEGVKVPETGFDESVRWHLFETRFIISVWKEREGEGGGGANPISKKMFLNSALIFINGWRAPTRGTAPIALKL